MARALDLLEALGDERELGLTELGRRSRLSPSTTHRQLATLAARGYVQRSPETGQYMLGHRLLQLARRSEHPEARLRTIARPYMLRIRKVCGETTSLAMLEGADIVCLEQLPFGGELRTLAELGRRGPAHANAAGKAMMAFMDPEIALAQLGHEPLRRFTEHTITAHARLLEELDVIRARGYALDFEEYEAALSCVAAPIFDSCNEVVGALSVAGPSARMGDLDERQALGQLLGSTAVEASRQLGYGGEWQWR